MDYFCNKICHQELSKVAQSGHTGPSGFVAYNDSSFLKKYFLFVSVLKMIMPPTPPTLPTVLILVILAIPPPSHGNRGKKQRSTMNDLTYLTLHIYPHVSKFSNADIKGIFKGSI